MDPNAALEQIRRVIQVVNTEELSDPKDVSDILYTLVPVIDELDAWIVRGGFLPTDWQPKKGA